METVQINLFDVLVDGHNCCIFEYSANAHGHTVGHGKKPLSYFRVTQGRGAAKREQRRVAYQQLVKIRIVLPRGEFEGLKAVGELLVGQKCGSGFLRARTDERYSQVISEKANTVENDSLLSIGSGQQAMNLIDDEHADIHLPA